MSMRCLRAAAGFVMCGSRFEESLDSLGHQAALFAFEVFQLVCCRLGGTDVLCRRGIHGAIGPEQVGDGHAALSDRA